MHWVLRPTCDVKWGRKDARKMDLASARPQSSLWRVDHISGFRLSLSSKQGHGLGVSGCIDVRRHAYEPLNRYLCTSDDRSFDNGFARSGILTRARERYRRANGIVNPKD